MFEKSCQCQIHRTWYRLHASFPEAEVSTYPTEFEGSQDFSNTLKRSPNSMRRMISGQRGINHVSSARFELLGQKAANGISSDCHLCIYKMATPEYSTACRGILRSLTQFWKSAPEDWL